LRCNRYCCYNHAISTASASATLTISVAFGFFGRFRTMRRLVIAGTIGAGAAFVSGLVPAAESGQKERPNRRIVGEPQGKNMGHCLGGLGSLCWGGETTGEHGRFCQAAEEKCTAYSNVFLVGGRQRQGIWPDCRRIRSEQHR
jgi:hypothetical protein